MAKQAATREKPMPAQPAGQAKPAAAAPPIEPARDAKRLEEAWIRQRAYMLWEAAGKPSGDGVNFWLEAERQLKRAR
jgi:hypothetical protein